MGRFGWDYKVSFALKIIGVQLLVLLHQRLLINYQIGFLVFFFFSGYFIMVILVITIKPEIPPSIDLLQKKL